MDGVNYLIQYDLTSWSCTPLHERCKVR